MRYVILRMHARVGAAHPDHRNVGAQPLPKRSFQNTLHRSAFGLALPTKKIGAVVGQAKRVSTQVRTLGLHERQR
jgi:hypothetical protein